MKTLRIGIIGAGRMGGVHVGGFKAVRGVEIAAIADTDLKRAGDLASTHALSAKLFADYRKMLREDLDAVSIVTPNFLHAKMALQAIDAGADVLCEKPMAPTVKECDRMIRAAARKRRVLMVNHSLRFNPQVTTMKRRLAAGAIGKVFHARMIRFGTRAPNVGWSPGADWFVDRKAGGGMANDIGIHLIDFANWCFGEPKEVWGRARTLIKGNTADDNVVAFIQYAAGASVIISLSWTAPMGRTHYEFYGTKGMLEVTGSEMTIHYAGAGRKPKVIPKEKWGARKSSYEHFAACVRGRKEPLTSGREARRAVEVTAAIHASR